MAQKRAARRGRKAVSSPGSKDSVELGRNGEYLSAKEPSPEGGDGSQSDHFRKGSESTDEEIAIRALAAMAAARDGPPKTTKPSAPATAEPTSSSEDHGGLMSSTYSTSRRQAKKLPPSEEEEEDKKKESEEEWTEALGSNPQPKRKRASGRVTRSQKRKVPAPTQQQGKGVPQPSESKKSKSKKITPAPLQQQLSESEIPKSKNVTQALLQQQGEERAQPSKEEEEEKESEEERMEAPGPNPQPKGKRASSRVTRSQQRKMPAPAQQGGKEVPKPSESKKITLAPLQQQLSESEIPKSKKVTPAPLQQKGEERSQPSESEMPKAKRIRRIWTPSDEVQILTALVEHRLKQGKLPAPDNNDFFDSIAERLEDKSCTRFIIKDKVRSLMRRYKSYVAPTTDHEQRLLDLSNSVWGDLPAAHTTNSNNGGEQDEEEHIMAEAENGGGQPVDKSFEEMCEMYPLLGQEVKRHAGVQPALRSSFTGLDGKMAFLMEKKLDRLKWKELKIQAEMETKVEAPKTRIRKQLVNFLSEVSKNV